MTFIIANLIKETTTTTGAGSLTLGGAITGCRAFSAVCANNDTVPYVIGNPGVDAEWEIGLGTWQTGGTLVRTTIINSSNAGAAVNLSAGTKYVHLDALAEFIGTNSGVCDFRLTLTSGTAVTSGDVTGATSIYFTPFKGNQIAVFNGGLWRLCRSGEMTFALGTLASGTNYDLFVWNNAGTLTLSRGPAWTSNTARGSGAGTTELTLQDGVEVNAVAISGGPGAKEGRWVGTFRTTSTTTTEDSRLKRFVYNGYNQIMRELVVIDTTDSWSYTTNTIRQANGSAANLVEFVSGRASQFIRVRISAVVFLFGNSASAAKVGVGVDSTTTFSGVVQGGYNSLNAAGLTGGLYSSIGADYVGQPGLGYHFLSWNEKGGDGTSTFLGDNGGDGQQCGLVATMEI